MNRGRDQFNKYKLVINIIVKLISIFPKSLRIFIFNLCRNINGIKGMGLRYILLKSLSKKCGDNVSVHPNVYFFNFNNISIGNNVSIHPMCYIDGFGGINIGNNVSIAHGVTIMSSEHKYDNILLNIKDQGIYGKKVTISDNVWIGAKATVLAGNKIHSGSIIAAGAMVTKDVLIHQIVGGVPAKVIKERHHENSICT